LTGHPEETAALAAQGDERKFVICERCFASVAVGKSHCPECGATISSGSGNDPDDIQEGAELARANLLRLRGDYLAAEAECLKLLRHYPNNASAHTLLGDICAEKGDLDQSLQWYELSLDLAPDHAIQERAKSIKARIQERDQSAASRAVGIPAERDRSIRYAAWMLIAILVTGIACYAVGRGQDTQPPAILHRVTPPAPNPWPIPKPIQGVGSDLVLFEHIRASSPEAANLLMVIQDPRSKAITLSFDAKEDQDIRPLGAKLAAAALDNASDALLVTVRAMRGGNLIYTADVLRVRYNETKQTDWIADNKDTPDAWISHVLDNEWSYVQKSDPNQQPTNNNVNEGQNIAGTETNPAGGQDQGANPQGAAGGDQNSSPSTSDQAPDNGSPSGSGTDSPRPTQAPPNANGSNPDKSG
jgi:hypothetical protein